MRGIAISADSTTTTTLKATADHRRELRLQIVAKTPDKTPEKTPKAEENASKKAAEQRRLKNGVSLFKGHLILDMTCPKAVRSKLEIPEGTRDEYSHIRYSAVTCRGEEFAADPTWRLRQSLFRQPRVTDLFVSVAVSQVSNLLPALQKLWTTFDHLDSRAGASGQTFFGDLGWKRRVLHIHCSLYPDEELQAYFNEMGVRPTTPCGFRLDIEPGSEDFHEMELVNSQDVMWHIYEVGRLDVCVN